MKTTTIVNKNEDIHPETFELLLPSFILKEEAAKGNIMKKEDFKIKSFIAKEQGKDRVYKVEWEKL